MELEQLKTRLAKLMPEVDFCSFRYDRGVSKYIAVRGGVALPYNESNNSGIMVTIFDKGGIGYFAGSDITEEGLNAAILSAKKWAEISSKNSVIDFSKIPMPSNKGKYSSTVGREFTTVQTSEHYDYLLGAESIINEKKDVIDSFAGLQHKEIERLYYASNGADIEQKFSYLIPSIGVRVSDGIEVIERSSNGDFGKQSGLELLEEIEYKNMAANLLDEAKMLLKAENCPSDKRDLLLDADQMLLQIHESIGHPLELDRILGDERNYAGTSFVNLDMFGNYRYGSDLLNVVFDPTDKSQLASYGFDDDGEEAKKVFVIEKGILKKPLGGVVSQHRAKMSGVANSRAQTWNRPAIDRMANLNLEPGEDSFSTLVSKVENGIYMKTNSSWSIDDSRNKFQFGCQYGRLIENGELTRIVKKPNYRGISSSFWRSLIGVGDKSTRKVMGTPYCGKGEPNQVINVGHASPACLFSGVEVFGGQS